MQKKHQDWYHCLYDQEASPAPFDTYSRPSLIHRYDILGQLETADYSESGHDTTTAGQVWPRHSIHLSSRCTNHLMEPSVNANYPKWNEAPHITQASLPEHLASEHGNLQYHQATSFVYSLFISGQIDHNGKMYFKMSWHERYQQQ